MRLQAIALHDEGNKAAFTIFSRSRRGVQRRCRVCLAAGSRTRLDALSFGWLNAHIIGMSERREEKLPAAAKQAEVDAFLRDVAGAPKARAGAGRGRLIFAMDATASREPGSAPKLLRMRCGCGQSCSKSP